MAYTDLGTDISWWQGIVNFIKMKLAGTKFVFVRAGSCNSRTGVCYPDYALAQNGPGVLRAALGLGFYWFYREFGPEHARKQARAFWSYISEYKDDITEGLVCDCETYDMRWGSVKEFMRELKEISGLPYEKLGIYCRALQWNTAMHGALGADIYFLWVARWHTGITHPWADSVNLRPKPWMKAKYWQFSADKNGRGYEFGVESEDIDLNVRWVEAGPDPEPLPIPHVIEIIVPKGDIVNVTHV